jgi:aminoglycoside phosphotransferase (APT) family kinase protein
VAGRRRFPPPQPNERRRASPVGYTPADVETASATPACHPWHIGALRRARLVLPGEEPMITPLAGGVSSDIVRVDAGGRSFCVKRALAQLKVAAEWRAPIARNHSEAEWIRVAGEIVPDAAPRLLAEDVEAGLFAMEWLAPEAYPVWKARLADGTIEPATAGEVGRRIARIHAATAGHAHIAARFANDDIFWPIRLEPYLLATAARHPDVAAALRSLAETTAGTKRALVHGDVSPKNILIGPRGPVFLDAECAWYGDPAFDLAFCLNHLLLKCAWRPQWRDRYLACFRALAESYLPNVKWEPADAFEARCARLLPGLFLARVDGKSPVEYLASEAERQSVRDCAKPLLVAPRAKLAEIAEAWRTTLAHG